MTSPEFADTAAESARDALEQTIGQNYIASVGLETHLHYIAAADESLTKCGDVIATVREHEQRASAHLQQASDVVGDRSAVTDHLLRARGSIDKAYSGCSDLFYANARKAQAACASSVETVERVGRANRYAASALDTTRTHLSAVQQGTTPETTERTELDEAATTSQLAVADLEAVKGSVAKLATWDPGASVVAAIESFQSKISLPLGILHASIGETLGTLRRMGEAPDTYNPTIISAAIGDLATRLTTIIEQTDPRIAALKDEEQCMIARDVAYKAAEEADKKLRGVAAALDRAEAIPRTN